MSAPDGTRSGWLTTLGLLLPGLLVGLWARLARYPDIFVADTARPLGGDSAYHLHRTRQLLEGAPVQLHDPWLNWPDGTRSLWAPGFDVLGAIYARVLGAFAPELALVTWPVLLAALTTGVVVLVTRRLAPERPAAAFLAGLFFAVLPQAVAIGMLGRNDHHVAEALGATALLLWALRSLDPAPDRSRLAHELVGATLLVAFIGSFTGGIVYAGLTLVALAIARLGDRDAPAGLGTGALAYGLAAGLLAVLFDPLVAEHGHAVDYRSPSYLQPGLLAAGGAGLAAFCAGQRYLFHRRIQDRNLAIIGLIGLAGVGGLVGQEILHGASEFLGGASYLGAIEEMQPLRWDRAYAQWGALAAVVGPALVLVGVARRDRGARLFVTLAVLALGLAVNQNRFGRGATGFVAIAGALGLATLLARLPRRRAALTALAGLALLANPRLSSRLVPELRGVPSVQALALDLRRAPGPVAPGQGEGVLARWDHGFEVLYLARRPVLSSGFGPFTDDEGYRLERGAWYGTPEALDDLLRDRDLGWVVAGYLTFRTLRTPESGPPLVVGASGAGVMSADYQRALPTSALIGGGSGSAALGLPHLPHLAPRFASPRLIEGTRPPLAELYAFERVEGARLVGRAAPGARIVAQGSLPFVANPRPYEGWTDADAQGDFTLIWPLEGPVRVTSSTAAATLDVPAAAVRGGHRIDVSFSAR